MPTKLIFQNQIVLYHESLKTMEPLKDFIKKSFNQLPQEFSLYLTSSMGYQLINNDEDLKYINQDKESLLEIHIRSFQSSNQQFSYQQPTQFMNERPLNYSYPAQNQIFQDSPYSARSEPRQFMNQYCQNNNSQTPNGNQQQFFTPHPMQGPGLFQSPPFDPSLNQQRPFGGRGLDDETLKSMIREEIQQMIPQISSQVGQVKKDDPKIQQNKAVHYHYVCDGCEMSPIVGIRYRCSVNEDFDYCENCEETKEHPYPFLKIKTPKNAPKFIKCTMKENVNQPQQNGQNNSQNQREFFRNFCNGFNSSGLFINFFNIANMSQNFCQGGQEEKIKEFIEKYYIDKQFQNEIKSLVKHFLETYQIRDDQQEEIKNFVQRYSQMYITNSDLQNKLNKVIDDILQKEQPKNEEQQPQQNINGSVYYSNLQEQEIKEKDNEKIDQEESFVFEGQVPKKEDQQELIDQGLGNKAKYLQEIFGGNVEDYYDLIRNNNCSLSELALKLA